MTVMIIHVQDIRQDDVFVGGGTRWTALEDAVREGNMVSVGVIFNADGGTSRRTWDNPNHAIEVERLAA